MEIDSALAVRLDPQASLLKVDCSIGRGSVEPGFHPVFFFLIFGFSLPELFQVSARLFPRVKVCISGVLNITLYTPESVSAAKFFCDLFADVASRKPFSCWVCFFF